jgi:hypothetical protein
MNLKWILLLLFLPSLSLADPATDDNCANLLAVLNRPTVSDSVCVVKPGQTIVELGTQYVNSYPNSGHSWNYPEMQVRFGLPGSNEFTFLAPNYIDTLNGEQGFTPWVVGGKHQFPAAGKWQYTVETYITTPTGDSDFGSQDWGLALLGIVNYNITDVFSVEFQLGLTTETTAISSGGERYNSINPDLVLAWQWFKSLQLYAEFYGQTQTAPGQGSGFNADAGIQYLPVDNIELDLEYGQRLSGELGNLARYIGAGVGLRF